MRRILLLILVLSVNGSGAAEPPKLADIVAYMKSLPAPKAPEVDAAAKEVNHPNAYSRLHRAENESGGLLNFMPTSDGGFERH